MTRPLRIELAGGVYHVTSRGDGRDNIYLSDVDRESWLEVFGSVCERFNWVCRGWCRFLPYGSKTVELDCRVGFASSQ